MEATVPYAKTTDGTSIALRTLVAGEPLVYLAGAPWCHVELLQIPQFLDWCQLLAENRGGLVRHVVREMWRRPGRDSTHTMAADDLREVQDAYEDGYDKGTSEAVERSMVHMDKEYHNRGSRIIELEKRSAGHEGVSKGGGQ